MLNAKNAKQTSFGFDAGPKTPAKHEYKADFTVMFLGHMAGEECRVIKCPVCNRHCISQERAKQWRFIHRADIQSTPKATTWEPTDLCTMNHQDLQTLRDLGVVKCNRLGQILSVK
jgi:hypothetical protein